MQVAEPFIAVQVAAATCTVKPYPGYMDFWMVPTVSLLDHEVGDMFAHAPWGGCSVENFNRQVIQDILSENLETSQPWDSGSDDKQTTYGEYDPLYHAKRVAWLIKSPSFTPIIIDVGFGGFTPKYLIQDGNHRLAAAYYRVQGWVPICYSGSVSLFNEMFPKRKRPTKTWMRKYLDELRQHDPELDLSKENKFLAMRRV